MKYNIIRVKPIINYMYHNYSSAAMFARVKRLKLSCIGTSLRKKKQTARAKKKPILKYYNVFHISQVEGVEPLEKPFSDVQPVENAEQLINDYVARERINYKETISNKGRQSR